MSLTVICSKWGTAYGPEYVNRLSVAVQKHLHVPHEFVCFTDNPDGVDGATMDIRPLWEGKDPALLFQMQGGSGISAGYPNLYMFRRDFPLPGRILYLDLDVVITGDLGPLVVLDEPFIAISDWWMHNWNGSVTLFTAGFRPELWEAWPPPRMTGNGQDWLLQQVPDGVAWPDAWVRSYKIHCREGIPEDCRIVVFHGQPKPHEVTDGWVKEHWHNV